MINDSVSVAGEQLYDIININVSAADQPLQPLALIHLHHNHSSSAAAAASLFPPLTLQSRSLVTSATMFAVGVLGNLIAIVVLCISKKEQKETTFYTLVCGMAITDLLGTCFTSPVVIATYVCNRWPGGELLCHFFSFSMLFFGSAGMSVLCAMAVERYLAINHAYFYSQYVDRAMARLALLAAYLANVVLCIMPSFGFGRHVKHFPGTWCFLDWRAQDPLAAAYSFLYGGVMLVLIAVTVLCNVAVCRSLLGMNQRTRVVVQRAATEPSVCGGSSGGGSSGGGAAHLGGGHRRRLFPRLPSVTSAAEIQMFWLLILMTIVFLVCSIPLVVRIFVNQLFDPAYVSAGGKPDYGSDLLAIRFASFNPILDPWVYILCRRNLLARGCARLKRPRGAGGHGHRVSEGNGMHTIGWAEEEGGRGGRRSPPSFTEHSNETSYASLRTSHDAENNNKHHHQQQQHQRGSSTARTKSSFADFAMQRQAWDYDTARVNFHPFSVNHHVHTAAVLDITDMAAAAAVSSPANTALLAGHHHGLHHHSHSDALLQPAAAVLYTSTKMDIVSCNFSTPSSRLSEKCL